MRVVKIPRQGTFIGFLRREKMFPGAEKVSSKVSQQVCFHREIGVLKRFRGSWQPTLVFAKPRLRVYFGLENGS